MLPPKSEMLLPKWFTEWQSGTIFIWEDNCGVSPVLHCILSWTEVYDVDLW